MSDTPYNRKQGEFELRILKDGRVVMIAPDETLLEIAAALRDDDGSGNSVSGEQNGKTARKGRRSAAGRGRNKASHG